MPEEMNDALAAADEVIKRTGGEVRLGMPLGLGKPNRFLNALYQRAQENPSVELEIYTALSLGRPAAGSGLEKRFLQPFGERIFGDYEEPAYLAPLRRGQLPDNIRVYEFFFEPGAMLHSPDAQRHYISVNYTHAARDLNARGVNVVAQMLAVQDTDEGRAYSFSCNPEVSLELLPLLKARREAGEAIVTLGQLHPDLPFMDNDARVGDWLSEMDILLDDPAGHTTLFSMPNMPVRLQDHFVGLHASTLIRDGGTLQIGIGALGDALVHHALRRHQNPGDHQALLRELKLPPEHHSLMGQEGGQTPFNEGLYGCSEMINHGLLRLLDQGVIRRPVYAWPALQAVVLEDPDAAPGWPLLDALRSHGGIASPLTAEALASLQDVGIVRPGVSVDGTRLHLPGGQTVANDLDDSATREALGLFFGDQLNQGRVLHGGFFLGPQAMYQRLRELNERERTAINMTRIGFINHLYGDEELKRLQRRDARFMNTAFSVTLLGAAVSDQIADGRVLSGVGGQYNFVSQAHELAGARSVIMTRAWRMRDGEAQSNVVFSYAHNTIPRHLRDMVVTEYGVADLRARTDEEVVMAMLNVADSRFQDELREQAQKAGKLRADYSIPERFRYNSPETLQRLADHADEAAFPSFPLGTDFDATEQRLLPALNWLKEEVSRKDYFQLGRSAMRTHARPADYQAELARMELQNPKGMRERLYQRLLLTALETTAG